MVILKSKEARKLNSIPLINRQLITACQKLDRKAQRQMMDQLASPLLSLSMRYARSREDAKDILQEALILIFNKLPQFKGEDRQFRPWCNRIVINTALGKYRKSHYQKEVELTREATQLSLSAPSILSQLHVEDILKQMDRLPIMQRHVFNLYVLDGFSHREIAEMLGLKESSSRALLTRARQSMRRLILKSETYINNES